MIKCFRCRHEYGVNEYNTKIFGTYVETTCPICFNVFNDKLLNLADFQTPIAEKIPARYMKARQMIALAEEIEKKALDEFAIKKKLQKKLNKKVEK